MAAPRALVPYHFGIPWDILPNRTGDWEIIDDPVLGDRITAINRSPCRILIAGDCLMALGLQRDTRPLVWYDAHGDWHTLETTRTGSIGGMPVGMLAGRGDQSLVVRHPNQIIHVGGSEFDPGERESMIASGVAVVARIADLPQPITQPIHLHVDTDVIRSADLPSSIHPAPNGLPIAQFWQDIDQLLPWATWLSIKTPDPRLDAGRIGEATVLELIRRFDSVHQC